MQIDRGMIVRAMPFVAVAAVLFLAACNATRNTRGENSKLDVTSVRAIEQLVAAQQFGEAIQTIERETRAGADRQSLLKRVNEQAAIYDQTTAAAIRAAAAREDWRGAFRLMYDGARNFPDGPLIRQSIEELTPRQVARAKELRVALMIERADWVLRSRPHLEELSYTEPSDAATATALDQARDEAKKLALELSNLGVEALNERNLALAERCLTKSDQLHPIAENILALERLDHLRHEMVQERRAERQRQEQERLRAENERRRQLRRIEEERNQQEARKLVEELRGAVVRSEFSRAQELLDRLREIDRGNTNIAELTQLLDAAVNARVDELLARGNDLYGNGNIREAREVWEQARLLDPQSSRIRDRILRADQVLENLNEQQRRTSAGSP
jgi:hypothetical protein